MMNLKTEIIIEALKKALELNLSNDFIDLLQNELKRRGMDPNITMSKYICY